VVAYTKAAPDVYCAIVRACTNRGRDGKMFALGSCVRASARVEFATALARVARCIASATDFDDLYDVIASSRVAGIGPTTVYCTALRLGAHLGLEPRNYLYLHAGPLQGWRRLTGERGPVFRVPWSEVPAPLRRLEPHRAEDFLCEMRELLNPRMLP
jgi:hypothetical protein